MCMTSLIWETRWQQSGRFWNVRNFILSCQGMPKPSLWKYVLCFFSGSSIADVIVEDQCLTFWCCMSPILQNCFIFLPCDESVEAPPNCWSTNLCWLSSPTQISEAVGPRMQTMCMWLYMYVASISTWGKSKKVGLHMRSMYWNGIWFKTLENRRGTINRRQNVYSIFRSLSFASTSHVF